VKDSITQQRGPIMYSAWPGYNSSARSRVTTSEIRITPMIAPPGPHRCRATLPRTRSPHDRFSMRFSPRAICDAKGSLTDRAFKGSFMQEFSHIAACFWSKKCRN
jgi:hypothetical protein